MEEDIRLRQTPAPLQRLRRSTLLIGALVVALAIGILAYVKAQIPPVSQLLTREQAPAQVPVALPEALKAVERPYAEVAPKPQPPVAQPLPKPAPPSPPVAQPVAVPPLVQAQTQTDPLPTFLDLAQKQQALGEKVATQHMAPQGAPPPKSDKGTRVAWRIKPTEIGLKKENTKGEKGEKDEKGEKGEMSKGQKDALARQGEAANLITPAVWARPLAPWKTLYRSQVLIGDTLDDISSDAPTPVRIQLTIPVFAKVPYDNTIVLDKGSIVIAELEGGKPQFGQSALTMKVVQIELPSSEVLALKSTIGIPDPKVNNHYGKLALATGINAVLSLGLSSIAGTPGAGQYYQDPSQKAAQEVATSATNDVRSITAAQLKVPPSLYKEKGSHVVVHILQNVTFVRKAQVAQ